MPTLELLADVAILKERAERAEARLSEALASAKQADEACQKMHDSWGPLMARLAEAEQDAARYRFIRNCCEVTCLGVEIESDAHIDQYLAAWPDVPADSAAADSAELVTQSSAACECCGASPIHAQSGIVHCPNGCRYDLA